MDMPSDETEPVDYNETGPQQDNKPGNSSVESGRVNIQAVLGRELAEFQGPEKAVEFVLCIGLAEVWRDSQAELQDLIEDAAKRERAAYSHVHYQEDIQNDQVSVGWHQYGACPYRPPIEKLLPTALPEIRFKVGNILYSRELLPDQWYSISRLGEGPTDISLHDVSIPRRHCFEVRENGGKLWMQPLLNGPKLEVQEHPGDPIINIPIQGSEIPAQGTVFINTNDRKLSIEYELSATGRGLDDIPTDEDAQKILNQFPFLFFGRGPADLQLIGAPKKVTLDYLRNGKAHAAHGWVFYAKVTYQNRFAPTSFEKFYAFADLQTAEAVRDGLSKQWTEASEILANHAGYELGSKPELLKPELNESVTITRLPDHEAFPTYPIVRVSVPWLYTNNSDPSFDFLEKLRNLAVSLDALHYEGMVHGDVKPANTGLMESSREVALFDNDSLGSTRSQLIPRTTLTYTYPGLRNHGNLAISHELLVANDRYGFLAVMVAWTAGHDTAREIFDVLSKDNLANLDPDDIDSKLSLPKGTAQAWLSPLTKGDNYFIEKEGSTCVAWLDRVCALQVGPAENSGGNSPTLYEDPDTWVKILYKKVITYTPNVHEREFKNKLIELRIDHFEAVKKRAKLATMSVAGIFAIGFLIEIVRVLS